MKKILAKNIKYQRKSRKKKGWKIGGKKIDQNSKKKKKDKEKVPHEKKKHVIIYIYIYSKIVMVKKIIYVW